MEIQAGNFLFEAGLIAPFPIVGGRTVCPSAAEVEEEQPMTRLFDMRGISRNGSGKWAVRTVHKKVMHRGGTHDDLQDAKIARDRIERQLGITISFQARGKTRKGGV